MGGSQKKRLSSAAAIVMSSIIISRLTGFLREMLVPNLLGTNNIGDAYNMAFRITGLMYEMLVGGAIAAALIPVLTSYITKDKEDEGWKAVGTFINVVFIAMVATCFLGMIFARPVVEVLAIGFHGSASDLTVKLTRILFPSVAFLMLAGITNGVLNSYQRFAAAAYGPSIYNVGSTLSILIFSRYGVEYVAYGVMCSSLIYFLFQLSFAFKNIKLYRFKFHLKHPGFIKIFKLAIPSLIASSIVQVNIIIASTFSTLFGSGSVTALQTADRIWQAPYGVFAQGMGIAMLPTLSARLALGEVKEFKDTLMNGLKTVLLLTLPSAIAFIALREPIITFFKFTNKFDASTISVAGSILMFFSIALLTQSIVTIINRAFYANNDTKTPLFIGVCTIVANYSLSYIFYKATPFGVGGMALAYSLSSTLNAVLLLSILNRKMKGIYLDKLVIFISKILPASIVMGLVIYLTNLILPKYISSSLIVLKMLQFLNLAITGIVGAIVYFLILRFLKVEEAEYILKMVFDKIKHIGKGALKSFIKS